MPEPPAFQYLATTCKIASFIRNMRSSAHHLSVRAMTRAALAIAQMLFNVIGAIAFDTTCPTGKFVSNADGFHVRSAGTCAEPTFTYPCAAERGCMHETHAVPIESGWQCRAAAASLSLVSNSTSLQYVPEAQAGRVPMGECFCVVARLSEFSVS